MHIQKNLVGRVGRDAESKFLPSGAQVTSFSVAEDRSYGKKKEDGSWENIEVTVWYDVSIWGGKANWAKGVKKGMLFIGTGDETVNPYINNAGEAAASMKFRASDFQFFQTVKIEYSRDEEETDVEF